MKCIDCPHSPRPGVTPRTWCCIDEAQERMEASNAI